jgi:hypothetical protein
MNYTNTFIQIAPDCPVIRGTVPVAKNGNPPFYITEYNVLSKNPYVYTLEEAIIEIHLMRKTITKADLETWGEEVRALLKKRHPCRTSALPKKFGWGVHFDNEGRLALYGMDSEEYQRFIQPDSGLTVVTALRNKRA